MKKLEIDITNWRFRKVIKKNGFRIINSNEFFTCHISYEFVKQLIPILQENEDLKEDYKCFSYDITNFCYYLEEIDNTFLFSNFNCNTTPSHKERKIFKTGINDKLDECDNLIEENINNLDYISKRFSKIIRY